MVLPHSAPLQLPAPAGSPTATVPPALLPNHPSAPFPSLMERKGDPPQMEQTLRMAREGAERTNSPETQSGCPLLRRGGGLPHLPGLVWQRRCSPLAMAGVSQLLINDDTHSAVTRFLPTSLREPRAPLRRARLKPTAPAVTRGARRMHTRILQLGGSETRHCSRDGDGAVGVHRPRSISPRKRRTGSGLLSPRPPVPAQ